MSLSGADLDGLSRLGAEFDRWSSALDRLNDEATRGVRDIEGLWLGADAGAFTQTWTSRHRPLLARAAADLGDVAVMIERNRQAQVHTSAADVVGSPAPGPGGNHGIGGSGAGSSYEGGDDGGWWGQLTNDAWSFVNSADDLIDGAVDTAVDTAIDTAVDLSERAGRVWDDATERADRLWNGFTNWVAETADDLKREAVEALDPLDDYLLGRFMDTVRFQKTLFNIAGYATPLAPLLPTARNQWNRHLNPWLVENLFELADRHIDGDPPSGDIGGTYTTRTSASGPEGPTPFTVTGDGPVERGRNAVIRALEDTADGDQIRGDEFELVDHGNGSFTVVLPGVTDLSSPNAGLNPFNRSVRDTDYAASRSAASAAVEDNEYARMVREYIARNVPPGSSLAIVGHSFGADTALDLAADPEFNGQQYTVSHVVAAAYHSEPQLAHVQDGTEVLVLQNNKDVPVMVEEIGHASSIGETFVRSGEDTIVREFDGGWQGAGHHQNNYIDYVGSLDEAADDAEVEEFFGSWGESGFGVDGQSIAVDVSVPTER